MARTQNPLLTEIEETLRSLKAAPVEVLGDFEWRLDSHLDRLGTEDPRALLPEFRAAKSLVQRLSKEIDALCDSTTEFLEKMLVISEAHDILNENVDPESE
jgi:hypothetical protein